MRLSDDAPVSVGFVGSLGRACFSDLWLAACPGRDVSYRTGARRALLAAVAANTLDVAIYPDPPEHGRDDLLLCEDRLVVALRSGHALAAGGSVDAAVLRDLPLFLPVDGEDSDFRRLVQALAPALTPIGEAQMHGLSYRLVTTEALALIAESQQDELRGDIVIRPLAGLDTRFALHLAWSDGAGALGLGKVLAAALSPPAAACAMRPLGRRTDDAGDDAGEALLD